MIRSVLCHFHFHYFHESVVFNGRGDLIVMFGLLKHTTSKMDWFTASTVILLCYVVERDLDPTGFFSYFEQVEMWLKECRSSSLCCICAESIHSGRLVNVT